MHGNHGLTLHQNYNLCVDHAMFDDIRRLAIFAYPT
jgi:hypothetical protein